MYCNFAFKNYVFTNFENNLKNNIINLKYLLLYPVFLSNRSTFDIYDDTTI